MIIVGITGSFGTGKTTVSHIFRELGAKVIDADRIVHTVIKPRTKVWRQIIAFFGKDLVLTQGKIDRKKLADIVFKDKTSLENLCQIIHPVVISEIKREINRIKRNNPYSLVVIDAPLLIETGLDKWVDVLVVVTIDKNNQISRLFKRNGLSKSRIFQRIGLQMNLKDKQKRADYIIDNNGTLFHTKRQVEKIWQEVWLWKKRQ